MHSESTILILPFHRRPRPPRPLSPLHPAFETTVTSLNDTARRWAGIRDPASAEIPEDLASRFASRLEQAKHNAHVRRRPEMPAPGPRHPAAGVLGPGRSRRRGPFQWNPEPPLGGGASGRSRAAGDAGLELHARFNFTRVPAVTDVV